MRMSLLGMGLVIALALAAATANPASAKPVLELKEEGVLVAVGTEVGVELATSLGRCKLAQRAHMSVNGAKKDKLTVEPPPMEPTYCPYHEGEPQDFQVWGSLKEILLAGAGNATLKGPLKIRVSADSRPPKLMTCMYEFRRFLGAFSIPGHAVVEGSMTGKLKRGESFSEGTGCQQSESTHFAVALYGRNNKLLEAELSH